MTSLLFLLFVILVCGDDTAPAPDPAPVTAPAPIPTCESLGLISWATFIQQAVTDGHFTTKQLDRLVCANDSDKNHQCFQPRPLDSDLLESPDETRLRFVAAIRRVWKDISDTMSKQSIGHVMLVDSALHAAMRALGRSDHDFRGPNEGMWLTVHTNLEAILDVEKDIERLRTILRGMYNVKESLDMALKWGGA